MTPDVPGRPTAQRVIAVAHRIATGQWVTDQRVTAAERVVTASGSVGAAQALNQQVADGGIAVEVVPPDGPPAPRVVVQRILRYIG
jgi:hypothetical protein